MVIVNEIWDKNLTKNMQKTDGSAKGPCSPKTGQKVAFLVEEKGFSKNPFSKGISDPKTGLKRAKGLSGPTLPSTLSPGFVVDKQGF